MKKCSSAENNMRISVIIATYNAEKTLQQCLKSVVDQTYENVELIIIDGGSTDSTVKILQTFTYKISYWISEKDTGIYNAWNKGLARATGDWICFLGADDYFCSDSVLTDIAEKLLQVPRHIDIAYGRILLLGMDDLPLFELGDSWVNISDKFKKTMCLPHPGLMHRKSIFEEMGGFDEKYKIAADYDFLLRVLINSEAQYIPEILTVAMRQGGISSNPKNTLCALKEVRLSQVNVGLYAPSITWLLAYLRVGLRLIAWSALGESKARYVLDFGRRLMGLEAYWTKTK
jgi:glycosyltransferase involved in cell wall biosynthesis